MENRLDVPFKINGTTATVTFIETETGNNRYRINVHKYRVQIGTDKLRRNQRWMDLDKQFFVVRYRNGPHVSNVSMSAAQERRNINNYLLQFARLTATTSSCAATGDVCSDALYPDLNKTCCEGSCERYPGSDRTNICVHGAQPTSVATRTCGAKLGEICDDTVLQQIYPKTCCEGTCTSVTARTSICMLSG